MNNAYRNIGELPRALPVFPLGGCLLLPRCEMPLNIFEPRYLAMVDAAMKGDRLIGMIQPAADQERANAPDLYSVGCAGRLTRFAETGDGRYIISLEGVCRFRVGDELTQSTPYRVFDVDFTAFAEDLTGSADVGAAHRGAVLRTLRTYAERNSIAVDWESIEKASDELLINALSMMSPFGSREKQALLEAESLRARCDVLVAIAEMEMAADGHGRSPLN